MWVKRECKWEDIYQHWKFAARKYPELQGENKCLKIEINEPRFGQVYHYNWIDNSKKEQSIKKDISALASMYLDIGEEWSKGTIKTAGILSCCETEEEFAAVWICAFVTEIERNRSEPTETLRNAMRIAYEAYNIFVSKCGNWHSASRMLFPESYIPISLFYDTKNMSFQTLVELAAINAALVLAHYTPVEYKLKR